MNRLPVQTVQKADLAVQVAVQRKPLRRKGLDGSHGILHGLHGHVRYFFEKNGYRGMEGKERHIEKPSTWPCRPCKPPSNPRKPFHSAGFRCTATCTAYCMFCTVKPLTLFSP